MTGSIIIGCYSNLAERKIYSSVLFLLLWHAMCSAMCVWLFEFNWVGGYGFNVFAALDLSSQTRWNEVHRRYHTLTFGSHFYIFFFLLLLLLLSLLLFSSWFALNIVYIDFCFFFILCRWMPSEFALIFFCWPNRFSWWFSVNCQAAEVCSFGHKVQSSRTAIRFVQLDRFKLMDLIQ